MPIAGYGIVAGVSAIAGLLGGWGISSGVQAVKNDTQDLAEKALLWAAAGLGAYMVYKAVMKGKF